jgi:hypothetical protein
MQLTVLGIDIDLQLLTGVNPFLCRSLKRVRNRRNHIARPIPFSFSMYSRTDKISLLIVLVKWEKKSGPQGPLI